jgi:2-polyprenyl-6-methoxyphenol hydroxylase-like FAD-dependent oxidoreductase
VQLLYDEVQGQASFRFGDEISRLKDGDEDVEVHFREGGEKRFDLVVIAEGIGSGTRGLVFGEEVEFAYLGLYTSYFTIPRLKSDTQWAEWYNAEDGIVYLLRPDNHGTMRVCVNYRSEETGAEKLPIHEQKQVLIDKIRGKGWQSERFVRGIESSDDFYLERLSQVKAPRWSAGRVVMIGDAAHCVTPIGGKGTDLAIGGAYILAGELRRHPNHVAAFRAYEDRLRPYVKAVQKLPPGVPGLVYPTSEFGVSILNGVFKLAGTRLVKGVIERFSGKGNEEDGLELPDYGE